MSGSANNGTYGNSGAATSPWGPGSGWNRSNLSNGIGFQSKDEGFHRPRDVSQCQFANGLKGQIEPPMHIVPNWARDTDAAHRACCFQPGSDGDTIPMQVGALG